MTFEDKCAKAAGYRNPAVARRLWRGLPKMSRLTGSDEHPLRYKQTRPEP